MGNIDEKRLSDLLERIDNIKAELEALENEVRGLGSVAEPTVPVTEPVEVTATVVRLDTPTSEATVPTETSSAPTDDTPIEIDIQGIDIPPIIEDPADEYHAASPLNQAQSISDAAADDIPATKPTSAVTEPAEVATTTEATVNQPYDDLPFDDDLPTDEASVISEQAAEPVQEPTLDIEPEIVIKPISEPEAAPKMKTAIIDSQKAETAVMDVMAEKQAWRTDRPGSQVKNVISAISLNDRVLLINVLFREDPLLFQNTISAFNSMTTLNEALSYIQTNFPDWDLNSEPVYRLMMAVRRKLK